LLIFMERLYHGAEKNTIAGTKALQYAKFVPMGIIHRLGKVIRSYLNDDEGPGLSGGESGDPDLRAAYAELDEFLKGPVRRGREAGGKAGETQREETGKAGNRPPESLRPDFAELGLPFGAGEEECRAAYKGLLKLHHPDRHAGHQANMDKATKKTARINAAYGRIKGWRETRLSE
jgi:hypothetical protein